MSTNATPSVKDALDPNLAPPAAIAAEIARLEGIRNPSAKGGGGYNDWVDGQILALRKVLAYVPARRAVLEGGKEIA